MYPLVYTHMRQGKLEKKLHIFLQHTYKNDVIIMEPHLNILKNSLTGY